MGRRADILDEGCVKLMNVLEWKREIGGCGAIPRTGKESAITSSR